MDNKTQYKINKYLEEYKNYKQLTNSETIILLKDDNSKKDLIEKVFLGNINLVIEFITKNYQNLSLKYYDIDDLIQEGNIVLLTAIKTFDNTKGSNFKSLFYLMMYQQLTRKIQPEFVNYSLPSNLKDAYYSINKHEQNDLLLEEIVKRIEKQFSIDENEAHKIYLMYSRSKKSYLNENTTYQFEDSLIETLSDKELLQKIKEYINSMSFSSMYVLNERFGLDDDEVKSVDEIAKSVSVTREKIRQIESKSLKKIRKYVFENNIKR